MTCPCLDLEDLKTCLNRLVIWNNLKYFYHLEVLPLNQEYLNFYPEEDLVLLQKIDAIVDQEADAFQVFLFVDIYRIVFKVNYNI